MPSKATQARPQDALRKALMTGNVRRATAALEAGALLLLTEGTPAEQELVKRERHALWEKAVEAPSADSLMWLVQQDASFEGPEFASGSHLLYLVKWGAPASLDWAHDHVLPHMPPLELGQLHDFWKAALAREGVEESTGVAFLLKEGLMPQAFDPQSPSALSQAMTYDSAWQVKPRRLADRLTLLVAHGHRIMPPKSADRGPFEIWLQRYEAWVSDPVGDKKIRDEYERVGPVIWDTLVKAGADPQAPSTKGAPLWTLVKNTALGRRYHAQQRLEAVVDQGPSQSHRRRLRS